MDSIDARVAALEDRDAIRELIAQYSLCVMEGDGDAAADLYTEDGSFIVESGSFQGREAIRAMYRRTFGPRKSIPTTNDHIIKLDGDDATATCVMHSPWRDGRAGGYVGRYTDAFRRVDGKWFFSERRFVFLAGKENV